MAKFQLTRDKFGEPIQTLSPKDNTNLNIGGSSVRAVIPADAEVVRVAPTVDCYVAFGDSGVVADTGDMNMVTGVEIFRVPEGSTHVAVIQNGAVTGVLSITKME